MGCRVTFIPPIFLVLQCLNEPIPPLGIINILLQLGQFNNDNKSWKEKLKWGLLPLDYELPEPKPIINKLDYD